MQCPRISRAKVVDDYTLAVEFSNQEIKRYTCHHLLTVSMFSPLQQPAFFKNFKVEPGGYALVWTDEIDISEYELWKNGVSLDVEYDSLQSITDEAKSLPVS